MDKKIPTEGPLLQANIAKVMNEGTRQRYAISAGTLRTAPAAPVKK